MSRASRVLRLLLNNKTEVGNVGRSKREGEKEDPTAGYSYRRSKTGVREGRTTLKAVILVSGGMDSTTLLFKAKRQYEELFALSFYYGQRHHKELQKAEELCSSLSVDWHLVDLTTLRPLLKGSALTDE